MGSGWIGHEVHVETMLNQIGGMWNPGTRWMGSRWDAHGAHVSAKKTPFGIHTETMCSLAFKDEALVRRTRHDKKCSGRSNGEKTEPWKK